MPITQLVDEKDFSRTWFLKQTFSIFLMWMSFYLATHFLVPFKGKKKDGHDLRTRIVAIFHGLICPIISFYYVYHVGIDFEVEIDSFSSRIIAFSLGYFFYDLAICFILGLGDFKLLLHHCCCFVTFGYIMYSGKGVFMGIFGLAIGESSNFPMNIRGICKLYHLRFTKIYEALEVFYFLIYIFTRGMAGPIVFMVGLFSPSTPIFIKLSITGIVLQSFFFIRDMFKILIRKYNQYLEREEKNIRLFWFSHNPETFNLEYIKKRKPDTGF